MGLPIDLTCLAGLGASADGLLEHMRTDKKVRDGCLTFILARGIGRAFVCRGVKDDRVRALLDASLKQSRDSLPQHS
jgi:3-dehydroquinate synthetase